MQRETCSGKENNPEAFITTGFIPWAPEGRTCQWIRIGRMRFGYYGGGLISRPRLARYETGWQMTMLNVFMSWTYAAALAK